MDATVRAQHPFRRMDAGGCRSPARPDRAPLCLRWHGTSAAEGAGMVQVRVAGVALDATQQHVILLKPIDELPASGQILPIWIGQQEATSILIAIEGAEV